MTHFDEAAIRRVLRWDELIATMEAALVAFSRGEVVQPLRSVVTVEEGRRYFGIMPVVAPDVMGAKLLSFYPCNAQNGIPTHLATIVLFDTVTGEPLATFDGRLITEMRTAAVSTAVTQRLMAPESHILALLGSGVQARAHLTALSTLRCFTEVRVWSPTLAHAERFAGAHGAVVASLEDAVRGADVIVSATDAREPILKGAWLKPGAHVNAVGAVRPAWRELDDEAMSNVVIVDSRQAALAESGDVVRSKAVIYGEAGELFSGSVPLPVGVTTVFKSVGLAVEDLAAARLVYRAARANSGA